MMSACSGKYIGTNSRKQNALQQRIITSKLLCSIRVDTTSSVCGGRPIGNTRHRRRGDWPWRYVSSGVGTLGHLLGEYWAQKEGLRLAHSRHDGPGQSTD